MEGASRPEAAVTAAVAVLLRGAQEALRQWGEATAAIISRRGTSGASAGREREGQRVAVWEGELCLRPVCLFVILTLQCRWTVLFYVVCSLPIIAPMSTDRMNVLRVKLPLRGSANNSGLARSGLRFATGMVYVRSRARSVRSLTLCLGLHSRLGGKPLGIRAIFWLLYSAAVKALRG